jgi:16S rRNA processing protein RimM
MGGMSSWRSSATRTEPPARLAAARISGVKGLRGGLRLELLTDWPERIAAGARLYVEGEAEPRTVAAVELGGRHPVLLFEGVTTRELAEPLIGRYLEVQAAPLPEGSYYWHQLEGLRVLDVAGTELGTLAEVFRAGEAEVYRVEGAAGELLIPAIRDVVREIDLEAGRMVVDYRPEEVG